MIIVLVVIALFCGITSAAIADAKNRLSMVWFLLGLLFGVFALLVIAVLPSLKAEQQELTVLGYVRCPDCREPVRHDARICRHCRRDLSVLLDTESIK